MDPTTVFCPNLACPARGQAGRRNIRIHARQDRRFLCTECHKTFTATKGTAFYRLRTSTETVTLVVTLMAHGCPLQAIVVAFGLDERTVASWLGRAGGQGQAVQQHLVEQPHDLGEVQADEIRVKKQGGIVWMALALMVSTRLWLAGEVSAHRDLPLLRRRRPRVHAGALNHPLWFCPEGLWSAGRAVRETFGAALSRGTRGRPPLRAWPQVLIAQVVTRDETRRVGAVERRLGQGAAARVETIRERAPGDGVLNTAAIARLDATLRARLSALTRRGRALAQQTGTLPQGRDRLGPVENCCTPPESLRGAQTAAGEAGIARPPAMAAGLTEPCWRLRDRRSCHVPPPCWIPPKRRGRPARAWQGLVERWGS
jgi:transposase-like protein